MSETDSKLRIAVVLGSVQDYTLISHFESVAHQFEVHAFVAANELWLRNLRTSLTVHQFEHLSDMPGYLRGMEERLKDFDAIVCHEASKLSTFQAIRFAEQRNIPCAILTSEFHSYHYAEWANIRAMQQEVFKKSDQHWAFSQASAAMLRAEDVPEEKISLMEIPLNVEKFQFKDSYRSKFRNYVGIPSDALLIGINNSGNSEKMALEILNVLRLLKTEDPELFARTKVIFFGEGAFSQELKYKVHSLGFMDHVRILNQDIAPFARDLYCALDVLIQPKWVQSETHEPFPNYIQEAVLCGVRPILPGQVIYRELFSAVGDFYDDDSFQQIYGALSGVTKLLCSGINHRATTAHDFLKTVKGGAAKCPLAKLIGQLTQLEKDSTHVESVLKVALNTLRGELKRGDYRHVISLAMDMVGDFQKDPKDLAEIYKIKGDAELAINDLEEATESYSMVMQLDRGNIGAYKGLAQIAYLGHSHEEAVSFYKKALSRQAEDVDSLTGIAMVYRRLGLYDQAVYWLERSIHARREDKKLQAMLFKTCLESPNIEICIIVLERLRDPDEPNPDLDLTLGRLYLAMGKNEVGAQLVEDALGPSEAS